MPNDRISLLSFASSLAKTIALPILAEGYSQLLAHFTNNDALLQTVKEQGIAAVLTTNHPVLKTLQKHNKELVTSAEKEAESAMMHAVQKHYPSHAIWGEEHGYQAGGSTHWVFDPVDGTSAMIRTALAESCGIALPSPAPAFGITIALVEGEEAVLGVVMELLPQRGTLKAGHLWAAAKGSPVCCDEKPVTLPACALTLSETTLACTVPEVMFNTKEKWSGYQALADSAKISLRDQNCIGFMHLLMQGKTDIVYEADLAYHDAAALVPILVQAGIKVTDSTGVPLQFGPSGFHREFTLLAAQPALHTLALAAIQAGVPVEKNRFGATIMQDGYTPKFPRNGE